MKGEVDNRNDGVAIKIEGESEIIIDFRKKILMEAPAASQIKSLTVIQKPVTGFKSFTIVRSKNINNRITEISPDIAVCDECLSDLLNDPERMDYPLINCTCCGPRFTIIEDLPYDREKTTMKTFPLCENCSSDYNNISDRRFHAQPVACNKCGPKYVYRRQGSELTGINEILAAISSDIMEGRIVTIKGTGGYHLMCNALNGHAVRELRRRKNRDAKPFAVMFRNIASAHDYCHINKTEEKELL